MVNGKYQVVCTTWQIMHWWDLFNALKEDADFFLIDNNHRSWRDERFLNARPIPENVTFVPYYEKGKYDFAILNVDQQVINPNLGKSRLFRELKAQITDIPRVIINHASPSYPEHLCTAGMTMEESDQECRNLMHELVGDIPMIVNSYAAATEKEWGWGTPIWHGMDANEWLDLPKEPRVFTAVSIGGCDEYYNRQMFEIVGRLLKEQYGYKLWWAKNNVNTEKSLETYKTFLGGSLLYLDLSYRTPMNRARTEAMLSGCAVVQVEGGHDIERFLENGKNAYVVPKDPQAVVDIIGTLIEQKYQEALAVGQAGKETAKRLFNRERYRKDWLNFIHTTLHL